MTEYSALKFYREKNNLQYFTSPNSEKPMKAVINHLPPDRPAEDTSNSLEDLGYNVINARQMTATGTTTNGQTPV
jgi:hypothetical protein